MKEYTFLFTGELYRTTLYWKCTKRIYPSELGEAIMEAQHVLNFLPFDRVDVFDDEGNNIG